MQGFFAYRLKRLLHRKHGLEDGVPGGGALQHAIREHATVPANVLDASLAGTL